MKKFWKAFIILFLSAGALNAETKEADLAGSWYPGGAAALSKVIAGFLDKAKPPTIEGEIVALISPHAGINYSGPVAAYGYNLLKTRDIKTAIVVGFNHRFYHDGIAVMDFDSYKTPLGETAINRALSDELIAENKKIYALKKAFSGENSTELQILFLQSVLKDFKLILIHMGDQSMENSRILSDALYNVLKKRSGFILIASTDMSHYLPYNDAVSLDKRTISLIKELDPIKLYTENTLEGGRLMCGAGAVTAVMMACQKLGANDAEVLKYANSGDVTFDKSGVVGYVSVAIIKNEKLKMQNAMPAGRQEKGDKNMLNKEQRKKMLNRARESINYYLKHGSKLQVEEDDPALNKEMGAFVTLHKKGQLRGCIGNMVGRGPFYLTVRDMAVEAATGDPRFKGVTADEMKDIDIEISALSPMEKITDPDIIEVGKHGVLVRSGFLSGVYLPQVATETGWTKEEFMNSLCGHKAGMAPDAWKKGKCDMYIFTAEVFGEKE